jgi:hypothetical protein
LARSLSAHQESLVKITVIKKSSGKVKTMAVCPWILDAPPDGSGKSQ